LDYLLFIGLDHRLGRSVSLSFNTTAPRQFPAFVYHRF
jgi:hypothetical protein